MKSFCNRFALLAGLLSLCAITAFCANPSPRNGASAASTFSSSKDKSGGVKIIAAGWKLPTLSELERRFKDFEKEAPFDGVILEIGVSDVMNPNANYSFGGEIRKNATTHKNIPFQKYKHNFISTLIDQNKINWFDDKAWKEIANNWGVAAKAAQHGNFDGILFDPECYGVYPVNSYWTSSYYIKNGSKRSSAELISAARKRGREVGAAVFKEYPEITLFFYYLWSMNSDLLSSFANGLLDSMPPTASLVDGDEWRGYCAKSKEQLETMSKSNEKGYGMLDKKHSKLHKQQGKFAPAFYLDAYARPDESGCLTPTIYNSNPSKMFAELLKAAKKHSGGYIWIYGEKGTWWPESKPGNEKSWEEQLPGFRDVLFP